jgi:hypothetical protein
MAIKPASPIYYSSATGGLTTTTADTIAAAQAGLRNFLSALQFTNKSATASEIVVLDNATVIWRGYAPASATATSQIVFDPPLQTAANSPLKVGMVTTATATVVSAQGFTDP